MRKTSVKLAHAADRLLYIHLPLYSAFDQWYEADNDKTLRLRYDTLNGASVVLDVGGYEGDWASNIYAMYCCQVHVFEAVPEYAAKIQSRFAKNPDIHVYAMGLGSVSEEIVLSLDQNKSSRFKQGEQAVNAIIVRADDFLREHNFQWIDLIKINIEGAEYDLLEHLLDCGWIQKIGNIQVQFHDFFPDAKVRMRHIQAQLGATHTLTYQYEFVWENWRLKASQG
jgi:FkbM family methyltransferase